MCLCICVRFSVCVCVCTRRLVGEVMYCRILSELEGTRMVVHSHPFIPDDLAILCELAQLAKEQQEQAKTTGQ